MFGIVLWKSSDGNTAVVWCEDHGDLAFYRSGTNGNGGAGLDVCQGDLLHFDLSEYGDMRLVENPSLVSEDHYPSLAHRLKEAGVARGGEQPAPRYNNHSRDGSTSVLKFPTDVRQQPRRERRVGAS